MPGLSSSGVDHVSLSRAERGHIPYSPPGHKQGRGADLRVLAILGDDVLRGDMLATGGLDDRRSSGKVIEQAQELMADAVGADHAFFSTCGSSLSVKSAMLAVAGRHGRIRRSGGPWTAIPTSPEF
ncbi:MAG: Orn/Lys/Arg decarboxylase major region [Pseudonocardia sp.]|nr:Orn/Lys/Arg decarboxylase major region [Pseudonocardia sp.]